MLKICQETGKKIRERISVQKSAKIVLITLKVRGLQLPRQICVTRDIVRVQYCPIKTTLQVAVYVKLCNEPVFLRKLLGVSVL